MRKRSKIVNKSKAQDLWDMYGLLVIGIVLQIGILYGTIIFRGAF